MDTAVVSGVLKTCYGYIWDLICRSPLISEEVPKQNRVSHTAADVGQTEVRTDPRYPVIRLILDRIAANYVLTSNHIEVVLQVLVAIETSGVKVEKVLDLAEAVLLAVDEWRQDPARPEYIQRIAHAEESSKPDPWPPRWMLVAAYKVTAVLTRST